MARTCTICIHAAKEDIDKALLAGEPYRSVAKHYEASESSVYRHQQDHLPAAMVKALEVAEVAHGGTLLEQLSTLQTKALELLTKAEESGPSHSPSHDSNAPINLVFLFTYGIECLNGNSNCDKIYLYQDRAILESKLLLGSRR